MSSEDANLGRRFLADVASVITVGLVVLFVELFGQPVRRGFFCDDETIKYPYKPNTVTEGTIILTAVLIPLVVFIVTELWTHGLRSRNRLNVRTLSVPVWVKTIGRFYGVYILGLGFSQLMVALGKFTIGRLRPHFIAVCNPNVDCSLQTNRGIYIQNYTCSGDEDDIMEGRLSFPSGHAAMGFYAAVYVVAYLHSSKKWDQIGLLRNLVQFLFMCGAWYVSLSRVMDHWHHWSDVVVGVCLGTAFAACMIVFVSDMKLFRTNGSDELLPLRKINSTSYVASSQS